jgi:hypothetical protein
VTMGALTVSSRANATDSDGIIFRYEWLFV